MGCCAKNCKNNFHFPCGLRAGARLLVDMTVFCASHAHLAGEVPAVESFGDVRRVLFIESRPRIVADPRTDAASLSTDWEALRIGALTVHALGEIRPLHLRLAPHPPPPPPPPTPTVGPDRSDCRGASDSDTRGSAPVPVPEAPPACASDAKANGGASGAPAEAKPADGEKGDTAQATAEGLAERQGQPRAATGKDEVSLNVEMTPTVLKLQVKRDEDLNDAAVAFCIRHGLDGEHIPAMIDLLRKMEGQEARLLQAAALDWT